MALSLSRKVVLWVLGLLTALAVAGLGFIFVFNPLCTNEELSRVEAPDGKHVAVVFVQRCGDSPPGGAQISMYAPGAALRSWHKGNVLMLRAAQDGLAGERPRIEWLDAKKALLFVPEGSGVIRSADRFEDVEIVTGRGL